MFIGQLTAKQKKALREVARRSPKLKIDKAEIKKIINSPVVKQWRKNIADHNKKSEQVIAKQ